MVGLFGLVSGSWIGPRHYRSESPRAFRVALLQEIKGDCALPQTYSMHSIRAVWSQLIMIAGGLAEAIYRHAILSDS